MNPGWIVSSVDCFESAQGHFFVDPLQLFITEGDKTVKFISTDICSIIFSSISIITVILFQDLGFRSPFPVNVLPPFLAALQQNPLSLHQQLMGISASRSSGVSPGFDEEEDAENLGSTEPEDLTVGYVTFYVLNFLPQIIARFLRHYSHCSHSSSVMISGMEITGFLRIQDCRNRGQ